MAKRITITVDDATEKRIDALVISEDRKEAALTLWLVKLGIAALAERGAKVSA